MISQRFYAAVLTGRIAGLARPSVPYGLLARNPKGVEKPKNGVNVPKGRNNRWANF